ncbi:hypothetical protein BVI2075_770006 [Burkholderia vietnamiensis]|nr:hypothetical protein BVI2075_770006 [Burkholderia vietnamiensis]CAG9229697.1 hypothetical protein BVI1335_70254 [Burkholderia vietnamiensis]
MLLVGITKWKRGRRPTAWRALSSTRHRRREAGGVTAMLYRFGSARNPGDRYLRVCSERAGVRYAAMAGYAAAVRCGRTCRRGVSRCGGCATSSRGDALQTVA